MGCVPPVVASFDRGLSFMLFNVRFGVAYFMGRWVMGVGRDVARYDVKAIRSQVKKRIKRSENLRLYIKSGSGEMQSRRGARKDACAVLREFSVVEIQQGIKDLHGDYGLDWSSPRVALIEYQLEFPIRVLVLHLMGASPRVSIPARASGHRGVNRGKTIRFNKTIRIKEGKGPEVPQSGTSEVVFFPSFVPKHQAGTRPRLRKRRCVICGKGSNKRLRPPYYCVDHRGDSVHEPGQPAALKIRKPREVFSEARFVDLVFKIRRVERGRIMGSASCP